MTMAINYSEEDRDYIVAQYVENPSRETVDRLAEELERTPKSIIGKLSREKVYKRQVYMTKQNEKPITKIEIVSIIADHLDLDSDRLVGLDKTPKQTLKLIEKTLAGSQQS